MADYQDRRSAVFRAKMAVESQRYDDGIHAMEFVLLINEELTSVEMNLVDVACKNAILSRCSSLRILKAILQREGSEGNVDLITQYIGEVKEEIATVSTRTKSLLESHVIPTCSNENKVFCYKIIGDHFKYRAELNLDERSELGDNSSSAYQAATQIADLSDIPYINLVRLTLALNFSNLCHDILDMSDRACEIAETARNGAMSQIHTLNEEGREEIAWVLDKLQNNITIWAEANVANGVDGHNSSTSGDVDSQNPSSGDVDDDLNSSDGRNSYDADVDGGNNSSTTSTGSEDHGGILFNMPVVPR